MSVNRDFMIIHKCIWSLLSSKLLKSSGNQGVFFNMRHYEIKA